MVVKNKCLCCYCGGRLGFLGMVQGQFKYVCAECKKPQRSLEKLPVSAKAAFGGYTVEESVVEDELEYDPDNED